jgi:predicted signal transduction protein with EAL and GGDEF domain
VKTIYSKIIMLAGVYIFVCPFTGCAQTSETAMLAPQDGQKPAATQEQKPNLWASTQLTTGSKEKEATVKVDASIGLAQWQPGRTMQALIASADSAMYNEKPKARSQKARLLFIGF